MGNFIVGIPKKMDVFGIEGSGINIGYFCKIKNIYPVASINFGGFESLPG